MNNLFTTEELWAVNGVGRDAKGPHSHEEDEILMETLPACPTEDSCDLKERWLSNGTESDKIYKNITDNQQTIQWIEYLSENKNIKVHISLDGEIDEWARVRLKDELVLFVNRIEEIKK